MPDLPLSDEDTSIILKAEASVSQPSLELSQNRGSTAAAHGRAIVTLSDSVAHFQQDAPSCPNCGHVAVRNGACYKCLNCGESLGCS